jgi:hypothetical protein
MKAWAALLLPETGPETEQHRADKSWLLRIECTRSRHSEYYL